MKASLGMRVALADFNREHVAAEMPELNVGLGEPVEVFSAEPMPPNAEAASMTESPAPATL